MVINELHDDFGNIATIKRERHFPYRDAKYRETCYILSLTADYDNDWQYFVSTYPTIDDVYNELKHISCGTWH